MAASLGVLLYWGFTVDDALITARIAHHLSTGLGYRFNPGGEWVDAVTPLGWAHVLSLFARASPLGALAAARLIGSVSWLLAAAWLGYDVARTRGTLWHFALLSFLAPVGAWASAGMETGVIIALVTLSTTRRSFGVVPAAIAAALRPELTIYAFVLALSRASSKRRFPIVLLVATLPAFSVAVVRYFCFGEPYPLSAAAKPADLSPGLFYAVQALLLSGPFWFWVGPGWKHLERKELGLAIAIVTHLIAVALAGGDWMVLMRLVAPVLPAALRVASFLGVGRRRYWTVFSWGFAVAVTAFLGLRTGLPGRNLVEQRTQLMSAAKPLLYDARVVGALDVGWVGIVHPGTIVDFAGVTSPKVAHLAGGHTTKRIDAALLRSTHIDHLVLLLAPGQSVTVPWQNSRFARGVEYRVAKYAPELGCVVKGTLPLAGTSQTYVVLRCPTQIE